MKNLCLLAAFCLAAVSSYGAGPKPRAMKSAPARALHPPAASASAISSRAIEHRQELSRIPTAPSDKQENTQVMDHTWTNERLDVLHERGLISEFNRLPEARAEAAREVIAELSNPFVVYVRTNDTRWYSEQASALRTKIAALELELVRFQAEIQYVRNLRTMEAGLAFYQDTIGITPEAGIDVRKMLLADLKLQLDELSELARRNNIPPGNVRE